MLSARGSWRKIGRQLMQRLEASLAAEGNAAVGYLPCRCHLTGQSDTITTLKAVLAELKGRIAVVETTRGGWDEGTSAAPHRHFALTRMGPAYPASNVQLFTDAREVVLTACGYPV